MNLIEEPFNHVLDHGFVRLDGHIGDDLSVVNAARVSLGKRSLTLEQPDVKLIEYLMKHQHGTPFEHNAFRFHVKAPIFVFREWQRHRIGSFNELSARYTELPTEYYIPAAEDCRTQTGKPGAYVYVPMDPNIARVFRIELEEHCRRAAATYKAALSNGVARELARLFLPVNWYSEMYWTVNARSLMNFLRLRNAPTAQLEIRRYAEIIEAMWADIMPNTHAAFLTNGRQVP